jgi:serine/threonine protein kinase
MDVRVRVGGLIGLFVYYAIQLVVVQYTLGNKIADSNVYSFRGLMGIDIILLIAVALFLLCKFLAVPAVDRWFVFLDSILFALTYSWMVVASPVSDIVAGFFVINFLVTVVLVLLDLWEFRQFSSVLQRIQLGTGSRTRVLDIDKNPLRMMEEGEAGHEQRRRRGESTDSEEDLHRSVAIRSSANMCEVKYMPEHLDLNAKGVLDGFRVNLSLLPEIDGSIPRNLPWETFEDVVHTVDSSSCHIYTAKWGHTPVILKLIKEDRITSAVAVAEFDIEERVLSRVRHPHIVRLLGSGTQPRKFLVLEYLSGGTLSHTLGVRTDRAKQRWVKRFTLLETLKLAHGLAKALNYLHNEWSGAVHIIHRDLKPDNIGWSSDGVLKLFDFGLSVSVRAQRERTEQYRLTGNTGTLRYMAPEVVLGRSYHQSVDTYSFGILIWQVASGQVPFKDMGKKAYFDKVVIKGVRPPLDVKWPPAFCELLRNCWHEDKNARPSFAEVASALAALVAEEEEVNAAKSKHCGTRTANGVHYFVTLLHPLYIALSLILIIVAFVLATRADEQVHGGVAAGGTLGALAALAFYASLVNFLCGAWPLVPLHDPAAKLNLNVTAEVGDPRDVIRQQRGRPPGSGGAGAALQGREAAEVELTHMRDGDVIREVDPEAAGSLYAAARKANLGILHPSNVPPGSDSSATPSSPSAGARDDGADIEIAFQEHATHSPSAASTSSTATGKGSKGTAGSGTGKKGMFAGLQEKVARSTGSRAGQVGKRDKGSVIFSPLGHDEDDGEAAEP